MNGDTMAKDKVYPASLQYTAEAIYGRQVRQYFRQMKSAVADEGIQKSQ